MLAFVSMSCLNDEYKNYGSLSFQIEFADDSETDVQPPNTPKTISAGNKASEISYVKITVGDMDPVTVSVSGTYAQTTIENIPIGPQSVTVELQNSNKITLYSETKSVTIESGTTAAPSFSEFTALLTVTAPNGSESWEMGKTYTIMWVNGAIEGTVAIYLYKNSDYYQTIVTNETNDGSYDWTIPGNYDEGNDYKVRVYSTSDGSLYDDSNSSFTIQPYIYKSVKIGNQEWMRENLKVTHYQNGDPIQEISGNESWTSSSSGSYCVYDDDSTNSETYGYLYNWYAINDYRNIAPNGWHIPTDEEWQELETYLGMSQSDASSNGWRGTNEGGELKENGFTHWGSPNEGATNSSGFTALPSGRRTISGNGSFDRLGSHAYYWTSTYINNGAWIRILANTSSQIYRAGHHISYGYSIRCIKD